jgi:hypothetical protein
MIAIPGYEGLYSLSKDGVYSHYKNGFMKPAVNRNGYEYVGLRKNGKTKNVFIHRLVVIVLKGEEIPEGYEVDHIDRNKRNNSPTNLRVLSHRENTLHYHGRLDVDSNTHKNCYACGKTLLRAMFGVKTSSIDGLDGACKPCKRIYASNRRKSNAG